MTVDMVSPITGVHREGYQEPVERRGFAQTPFGKGNLQFYGVHQKNKLDTLK